MAKYINFVPGTHQKDATGRQPSSFITSIAETAAMLRVRWLVTTGAQAGGAGGNLTDSAPWANRTGDLNRTREQMLFGDDDYIFDRTDVRAVFITLYTLVFCCCFFGEFMMVILFVGVYIRQVCGGFSSEYGLR